MEVTDDRCITMLAVDPGLASVGFVVVSFNPAMIRTYPESEVWHNLHLIHSGLIATDTKGLKGVANVRKCDDTAARVSVIARDLYGVATLAYCTAISYEVYTPFRGTFKGGAQGGGVSAAAMATLQVCGGIITLATIRGAVITAVHPNETKKYGAIVPVDFDLTPVMLPSYKFPPSKTEHVRDAFGVAIAAAIRLSRVAV